MRQTILLADDSPTIQRLVANTFADVDFDIISVSNGEAAIRKFEEVHPHIVLADIYMPGKNGYEVCAYIKQHHELSKTPVVLLVGAFDAFDDEKAREAGAAANITKPFEPQALVDLVQSMLAQIPVVVPPVVEPVAVAQPQLEPPGGEHELETDLLGLEALFVMREPPPPSAAEMAESDIDRIADRVIQRLSAQVVESIAWEIVPDLAEKIVREELKKNA